MLLLSVPCCEQQICPTNHLFLITHKEKKGNPLAVSKKKSTFAPAFDNPLRDAGAKPSHRVMVD